MSEIGDFINARCEEILERYPHNSMPAFTAARWAAIVYQEIVEWHDNWPVLAQQPIEFEAVPMEFGAYPDQMVVRMKQNIQFLTHKQYIEIYGNEPPTAPILKIIAQQWENHPDYNREWYV